ncbi:MAG: site-2 protease family protein [Oscillospiraceae bacterium]|jgi:Zn-dependent protease|nr:site-2 protease family protein [Oscillospiraceae bacterium]
MQDRIIEFIMHGIVLLTAFPVHECAHALAAHWLGDDTAKNQGRISLNPLRHLDLFGTVFMLLAGFGWAKPVPINANNFKNRKVGMAVSSLAGPLSNVLMSYVSIVICKILTYSSYGNSYVNALADVFWYATILNLGLAVFNLLPVPPLDGSRIFNLVLPEKLYFKVMKYENIIFGILFLSIWLGFLDKPLYFLQQQAFGLMNRFSIWVDIFMIRGM